jgi:hypothetical protein
MRLAGFKVQREEQRRESHCTDYTLLISSINTMYVYLSIYLWFYSPLLDLSRFFNFLLLYTVGRTPMTLNQPVARLYTKHTQTSIPRVGFEVRVGEDGSCLRQRGHSDRHKHEAWVSLIPNQGCQIAKTTSGIPLYSRLEYKFSLGCWSRANNKIISLLVTSLQPCS